MSGGAVVPGGVAGVSGDDVSGEGGSPEGVEGVSVEEPGAAGVPEGVGVSVEDVPADDADTAVPPPPLLQEAKNMRAATSPNAGSRENLWIALCARALFTGHPPRIVCEWRSFPMATSGRWRWPESAPNSGLRDTPSHLYFC